MLIWFHFIEFEWNHLFDGFFAHSCPHNDVDDAFGFLDYKIFLIFEQPKHVLDISCNFFNFFWDGLVGDVSLEDFVDVAHVDG